MEYAISNENIIFKKVVNNSLISTLEREIPHITEEKVEDNDNDKDEEFIIDVS